MLEAQYQAHVINRVGIILPGSMVLKNDPNYIQGIPDLTVFYGPWWGVLEVKASEKSKERPNQRYYIEMLNAMSFAAFIYPENEEEVLRALQQSLVNRR